MLEPAKIKVLCLDIDQTLLDFDACAKDCMKEAFLHEKLEWKEEYFPVFMQINDRLWTAMENKELTEREFRLIRWDTIFQALGIQGPNGADFEDLFRKFLNESHTPVLDAFEALERLEKKFALYVVSNGPSFQQENRLRKAGMLPFFRHIFTSQEAGVKKPDPLFFTLCRQIIEKDHKGIEDREICIIGDSVRSDMMGGLQAGWQTLLFGACDKRADACARNWQQALKMLEA